MNNRLDLLLISLSLNRRGGSYHSQRLYSCSVFKNICRNLLNRNDKMKTRIKKVFLSRAGRRVFRGRTVRFSPSEDLPVNHFHIQTTHTL